MNDGPFGSFDDGNAKWTTTTTMVRGNGRTADAAHPLLLFQGPNQRGCVAPAPAPSSTTNLCNLYNNANGTAAAATRSNYTAANSSYNLLYHHQHQHHEIPYRQQQRQQHETPLPVVSYYNHLPVQSHPHEGINSYSATVAAYLDGLMDPQIGDDFEYFPRDRCHTWPGIQQRPSPAAAAGTSGGEMMTTEHTHHHGQGDGFGDDSQLQHQYSPAAIHSRTSSALSLISESNESLAATPTSTGGSGGGGGDWAGAAGLTIHEYHRQQQQQDQYAANNSQLHIQQGASDTSSSLSPQATIATTAAAAASAPSPADTSKRCTGQSTPTYKSGHPSYVELITQAILTSPEQRMTLSEIYDWMVANVPSFKDQRHLHSSAGWKNSVRHNLSLHARFKRVKRNGMDKPSWWTVDLSEEAKRERSKRPRQSRPRANTTTATSREFQSHRQQQAQQRQQQQHHGQQQQQGRTSLSFAQPYVAASSQLNDRASSGRGSMSFSGSVTPASSVGSDIFAAATVSALHSPLLNHHQHHHQGHDESLMPPPPTVLGSSSSPSSFLVASANRAAMIGDGGVMDWTQQYATGQPIARATSDRSLDSAAESSNLQCLSQAITVSLQDPAVTTGECMKPDPAAAAVMANALAANVTATHNGEAPAPMNYFAANTNFNSGSGVSNLVHALRENTLDESAAAGDLSSSTTRQMLRVQTNVGTAREMNGHHTPQSAHPSPASFQHQQGVDLGNATAGQQQHQPTFMTRFTGPNAFEHHANSTRKDGSAAPTVGGQQLPDDLATLDVGGFECNILDVLSYEMNCGSNNAPGFA